MDKHGSYGNTVSSDDVVELGRRLYADDIRRQVNGVHDGEFVAIHVDTGDFAVGRTATSAIREIRTRRPADGRVFIRRIGDEPEYELAARILAGEARAGMSK